MRHFLLNPKGVLAETNAGRSPLISLIIILSKKNRGGVSSPVIKKY
jgi:hypothetical protein